jgi:signal transduction histidine kinase
MVQRIVEKAGGRIWVESDGIGLGSCFRFTLPDALHQKMPADPTREA